MTNETLLTIFESIKNVTNEITLVAFIVAVISAIALFYITKNLDIIKTAPKKDQAKLIEKAMNTISLNTDNLTKEQTYNLALELLSKKYKKEKLIAIVLIVLSLIIAGFAFAYGKYEPDNKNAKNELKCPEKLTDSSPAECLFKDKEK